MTKRTLYKTNYRATHLAKKLIQLENKLELMKARGRGEELPEVIHQLNCSIYNLEDRINDTRHKLSELEGELE